MVILFSVMVILKGVKFLFLKLFVKGWLWSEIIRFLKFECGM